MTKDQRKWRHLYRYICKLCQKVRYTKNWKRHQDELCTICEKGQAPDGQDTLFTSKNGDDTKELDDAQGTGRQDGAHDAA